MALLGAVFYVDCYFLSGLEIHHSMSSIFKVSAEKSAVILMGFPLKVTWHVALVAFNMFSLFCMPNVLTII
jgi:hypothetical protein